MKTPDFHHSNRTRLNRKPGSEWHCVCGKLLGVRRGDRLHVRFGHSHEYMASLPVTATCRGCGALNEIRRPSRHPKES